LQGIVAIISGKNEKVFRTGNGLVVVSFFFFFARWENSDLLHIYVKIIGV